MKTWWAARNAREKLILIVGGIFLLLFFYYSLIISPLQTSITQLQQRKANAQELAGWMLAVAPEVQRLRRSSGSSTAVNRGGSLLSVVDETSKAAGLGQSMTRMQPEGQTEVRAWLDAAPFNETLRWLRTLESSYGVRISELSFNRDNEAGRVKARITFKRPI